MKGSALAASFYVSVRMVRREGGTKTLSQRMVPWCSGLAYVPVKDEIAGSNPVGTARRSGGFIPWPHDQRRRVAHAEFRHDFVEIELAC